MKHSENSLGARHAIHNWEYADAAERGAATGFIAADLNKVALQLDDQTYWTLSDYVAPTWVALGAGVADASVTNAKLANMATSTFKMRMTAGTGDPEDGTVAQANAVLQADGLTATAAGFRGIPQNSQSTAYTLVAADAGKHVYHPGADTTARTFTIPANSSVAFPIGTSVTFINDTSAGVATIAITTDTLVLAGAGTTGSRTLAANGMATAIKMTSTRWMIGGTGLT